jgi:polar amino acid transport system substrate-binding protein
MTKQSKYTFAVLGILVAALVAGVAGGKLGSNSKAATTARAADVTTPSWIHKIKSSGELRVGCADAPPTTVVSAKGTCSGPDLIPLQDLAKQLGVKFVTVGTTWQNIVAGLQADRYDIAANLDQTVERGLAIQFSDPSWSYPGVFLVPRSSGLTTSAQITKSSKPVATAQGTALDAALQAARVKELRVDTYENAASAVHAGRASAVFTDLGTAEVIATKDPSLGIVVPEPAIFVHHVAYGLPTQIDPRSMQIVNIAINTAVASGEITRGFTAAGYKPDNNLGNLEMTG